MKKPEQVDARDFIDFGKLVDVCKETLDYYERMTPDNPELERQSDYKNAIFEEAMNAVFGPNVFDFINSKT